MDFQVENFSEVLLIWTMLEVGLLWEHPKTVITVNSLEALRFLTIIPVLPHGL